MLKNGSYIAKHQFVHNDNLQNCRVFDAVIACYVHDLDYMAQNKPNESARQVVGDDQVECLYDCLHYRDICRSRGPPDYNPTIRAFVIDLASITGFESMKSQPLPRMRKLWQAFTLFTPALVYRGGVHAQKYQNKAASSAELTVGK